jgi:kynurenine formamidase
MGQVRCFHATNYEAKPYQSGDFIGAVKAGAPVNFYDVTFSPHGNGTHTECYGHITKEQASINDILKEFNFIAAVISVPLENRKNGDWYISAKNLKANCPKHLPTALVIRTLPNELNKQTKDYSGSNPPYLDKSAMEFIINQGVRHLLLDLPSVDKESDGGTLACHHLFWNVENGELKDNSRKDCTITELIFVPDSVSDGLYLLHLQIPSIILDAVPSKPILYKLQTKKNG